MADFDNPLARIQHIVVLMMENRSFDNLLGWLYDPANAAPFNQLPPRNFEGLYGKNLSNPGPGGETIPVGKQAVLTNPRPDPGETYENVYSQLYNVIPVTPLGKVPPNPPQPPGMMGFLNNYSVQPGVRDPAIIMACFTPASVPVLSALAYHYGVCDHWFASIPTETLCNRSFLHAGTSSGYVNNDGGDGILFVNKTTTIFNLLEQAKKTWKIYCASWKITSLALLTQEKLWPYAPTDHFAHLRDFFHAARRRGGLPNYSFIEPIYLDSLWWGAENDMHPEANPYEFYGPSNLEKGEILLYKIYQAVRRSPDWNSTLMIILFDEHGGCYDHVPPPAYPECNFAVSPDGIVIPQSQPGGNGFEFNRLGVRVPALIVSPFTPRQTLLNNYFDHTSVLSTVVNCFDLPRGELGRRQTAAPDVGKALTLSEPRTDYPPVPKPPESVLQSLKEWLRIIFRLAPRGEKRKPLSSLQKTILHATARRLQQPSETHERIRQIGSAYEADTFLRNQEAELLKRR